MSSAGATLLQLLPAVPSLIVYVGGLAAAVVLRPRGPAASTLAVIALGLLSVLALATPLVYAVLAQRHAELAWSMQTMGVAYAAVGLVQSVLHAAAVALLVAAAFVGRRAPAPRPGDQAVVPPTA